MATTTIARVLALGSAAIMAITLAGCAPDSGDSTDGEKTTLTLGIAYRTGSWNPSQQISSDSIWWWGAVYDTLLQCDPEGQPSPGAAETFEVNEDNTELTMVLRKGMTFEDGTPINAEAAKVSIENMRDGGGPDTRRVTGLEVEVIDDLALRVISPVSKASLASTFCQPPGIIASPAALASPDVDAVPVSSGPYALDPSNTSSGSVYTLLKRDDYWDAGSYPYDTVVINVMPDVTSRLNALKTGQIDGAMLDAATVSEAEASGLTVERTVGGWAGLFLIDRNGTIVPALGDARVRQAINMAFDRDAIVAGIFQGEGEPADQFPHPDSPMFLEDMNDYYQYDLDEARRLMAEAGYEDGFDIEIPSWAPNSALANPMIVQQFSELGIRVKEVPLTDATAIAEMLSGRFPIIYFGGFPTTPDPTYDLDTTFNNWNYLGATDPELDLLLAQKDTLQGEEAVENFRKIARFWIEEAWFAPWAHTYLFPTTNANLIPENTGMLNTPNLKDFKK